MNYEIKPFGVTKGGEEVQEFVLENDNGLKISAISYGAALRSIVLSAGWDIVLGFDTIEDYERHDKYMGAIVGRCANRISNGSFVLNGKDYVLAVNNGPNHLHGGIEGFDKKVWKGVLRDNHIEFSNFSPDGEEGYPGNLSARVTYTLTEDNEIVIDYFALCDEDTVVNLTNHTYFNLDGNGNILNHVLQIPADEFTEIDENGCSNGKIAGVDGTPFDFREPKRIGSDIDADCEQIKNAQGYDHNYILKHRNDDKVNLAARLSSGDTTLEVWTDQPGVHVYTGNFLDDVVPGKNGVCYDKRSGIAIETQNWPDAVNNDGFPTSILKRGEVYRRKTVFRII